MRGGPRLSLIGLVKGANLGPELVVNGAFADTSWWTAQTGWSIAAGKATRVATVGTNYLVSPITPIVGKRYRVTFTVSGYAGGACVWDIGGNTGAVVNGNGTYTQDIVCGSNASITPRLYATDTFAGSIDDVSIKMYQ